MIAQAPGPAPAPGNQDNGQAITSGGAGVSGGPNDQIEALTGRRHLSWSQLNSYRGCPRRWFFSHVEGLKPDFVSSALVLGSAVHNAVQHHYEQRLEGLPTTVDQLIEVFRGSWAEEAADAVIRYPKQEDQQSQLALGERMLAAFHASVLASPPGDLIAIEETVTGLLHPDMPDLLARVDVVWQNDTGLHLMDLKTSKSRWSDAKVQDNADQLRLYRPLAHDLDPAQPLHLHFGVVTKAKSPATQLLDLPPEVEDGESSSSIVDMMLPVWDAMKAGVDFTSPSPMSCSTCGYKSHCPAHPHPRK